MVTIEDYRKVLKDDKSSDEQITEKIQYLKSFCKNIIRSEIENYVRKSKQQSNNCK